MIQLDSLQTSFHYFIEYCLYLICSHSDLPTVICLKYLIIESHYFFNIKCLLFTYYIHIHSPTENHLKRLIYKNRYTKLNKQVHKNKVPTDTLPISYDLYSSTVVAVTRTLLSITKQTE